MKKFILLFVLISLVTVSQGQFTWQVITESNELQFSTVYNYDVVRFSDCSFAGQPGAPQLPCKVMTFVLPYEAVITGISVTNTEKIPITGQYYILPIQPLSVPDGSPVPDFIPPDPAIYNSQTPFPSQITEIIDMGFLMDYLIVTVRVCPFEYIPGSRQLSLYRTIEFDIEYTTGAAPFTLSPTITEHRKAMVQNFIKSVVTNQADVSTVTGGINNVPVDITNPNTSFTAQFPCNIYGINPDYIVITTNALRESFAEFVKWKNQKGIPTVIVTLEDDIIGKYPGNDTADQIREFTNDLMSKWWGVGLFFLIGGDVNIIPTRIAYIGDAQYGPTDLYFASKDNPGPDPQINVFQNWNGNGNHIFGEYEDGTDDWADAFIGRIPVREPEVYVFKTNFTNPV